jgi:hypothetical protein
MPKKTRKSFILLPGIIVVVKFFDDLFSPETSNFVEKKNQKNYLYCYHVSSSLNSSMIFVPLKPPIAKTRCPKTVKLEASRSNVPFPKNFLKKKIFKILFEVKLNSILNNLAFNTSSKYADKNTRYNML